MGKKHIRRECLKKQNYITKMKVQNAAPTKTPEISGKKKKKFPKSSKSQVVLPPLPQKDDKWRSHDADLRCDEVGMETLVNG